MAEIDTQLVNVGLSPNDGTGNNIREAFIVTNQNITAITEFLTLGPRLSNVTVSNTFTTNNFVANSGIINDSLHIVSTQSSISPSTGALIVDGGTGIAGDLHIGGTVYGDIQGDTVTASTLGVIGGAVFAGNVNTGELSVGTSLVPMDAYITRNLQVDGTLTVLGNITTVTTSEFKISDPIIEIGGVVDAELSFNDSLNRGLKFYYYSTDLNSQRDGFFGFDQNTEQFTYINDGLLGSAKFDTIEANVISTGNSTFNTIHANGIYGNILTTAQPAITSVGELTNLSVVGPSTFAGNVSVVGNNINVTGGMLYINGVSVATSAEAFTGGTVTNDTIFISGTSSSSANTGAVRVVGGVGVTGDIFAGNSIIANSLSADTITGLLETSDQPNITSVGTLGNLDVNGSLSSYGASAHHLTVSTFVNAATLGGSLSTGAQPNITSVGTLSTLSVTGNVTASEFHGTLVGPVVGNVTGSVSGFASAVTNAAQPSITSVGTLTGLTVSGTATIGSLNTGAGNVTTTGSVIGTDLYGQVKTSAQPSITSVGNLTSLTVSGTSNLIGAVTLSSTLQTTGAGTQNIGTVTNKFGDLHIVNVNSSGRLISPNIDGIIGGFTPAAGNFTTVTASGQIWSTTGGIKFPDGTVQTTAGVAGSGTISYATTAGSITNQANSATITAASNNTANTIVLRDGSGNFSAGTITATVNGSSTSAATAGTVTTAAQPAITSVGTLTGLTVSGAISCTFITGAHSGSGAGLTLIPNTALVNNGALTLNTSTGLTGGGSVAPGGTLSLSTNATAVNTANTIVYRDASGNFNAGTITATLSGNATSATTSSNATLAAKATTLARAGDGTAMTFNWSGQAGQPSWLWGGSDGVNMYVYNPSNFNVTSATTAGTVTTAAQPAITSVGTLTGLTVSGAISCTSISGNGAGLTSIANSATTATSANTANTIVLRDSSGNFSASVITAVSSNARYADLAEMYKADFQYKPGTVLIFGGDEEVTTTRRRADSSVAGVVSTAPAYLMNIDETGAVPVALRGKVPVKLIGPVKKGDLLVTSAESGYGESIGKESSYGPAVFAKSLEENLADGKKIINAVII